MKKKFPFWISFINEPSDNGGGEGQGEPAPVEPAGSTTLNNDEPSDNGSDGNSGHNPNWNGLLEVLPDEYLKNKALPFLEEYDRNNNKRFEKVQQQFSPYQPLVDNNVPWEQVELAFQLRAELQQNPQAVFEKIAQHLGYDISKLTGESGDQNGQGLPNQPEEPDLSDLDPRLAEYIKNQQQIQKQQDLMLQSMMMNQQHEQAERQQQMEKQWFNETVSALDKLDVPKDKVERNRFVDFALMEQRRTGAKEINWKQSWDDYRTWRGPQANQTAPNVTPGNGSLAAEKADLGKLSTSEANDLVVKMLAQKAKQNQ